MNIKEKINLLFLNHQQIHENICFADRKAGAVIAADGALLALSYQLIDPIKIPYSPFIGFLVCFILAIGIGFAFWVVRPRGEQNRERGSGMIDSIRIKLYSYEQFQQKFSDADESQLLSEIVALVYDRSHIDQKKYLYLKISMILSFFGWISAFAFAAWVKVFSHLSFTKAFFIAN